MKAGLNRARVGNFSIKKVFAFALCALLFLFWSSADAQRATKVTRIGYLSSHAGSPPTLPVFKASLAKLGWVEGTEVEFLYRYGAGRSERYSAFADELVEQKVDVIVTGAGNEVAFAAKRATATIPIVMVGVIDPVGSGLVASLARPGGNITGLTFEVTREQAGKNLALLKEAVPKVSIVSILRNPNNSRHIAYGKEAENAAKTLGVKLRFAEFQAPNDKALDDALRTVVDDRAHGLIVTPHPYFNDRRQQIVEFATRHKLPAIYPSSDFTRAGGLISYSTRGSDNWRRAAVYVDKILKGTKPADLPVEQPMKYQLVINLKAAQHIDVTIAPNLLARADRVIR